MRRLLAILLTAIATIFAVPAPAQAQPWNTDVCFWTRSDSATPITIQFEYNYGAFTRFNDAVYPNTIEGEYNPADAFNALGGCEDTSLNPIQHFDAEPKLVHVTAGYCITYRHSTDGGHTWSTNTLIGPAAGWYNYHINPNTNYGPHWLGQGRGYAQIGTADNPHC